MTLTALKSKQGQQLNSESPQATKVVCAAEIYQSDETAFAIQETGFEKQSEKKKWFLSKCFCNMQKFCHEDWCRILLGLTYDF